MSKGKLNVQAADGAVIGLVVPDGLTSGERQITLGANLSGITAYHLLQGNLAVSNSTITQGFNTTLFTGNGTTQAVNTGIDMDTQWGNTVEEKFGGLVWGKQRTGSSSGNHWLVDTVRGNTNSICSNLTNAQNYLTSGVSSFTNTGFSLSGGSSDFNNNASTMASWNFQTTHRVSGTTNHGKAYTCHYNPFTGFTMVKYEGSGIAGHEIPHHLGRKLGFCVTKSLSGVYDWVANAADKYLYLNKTDASPSNYVASNETVHFVDGTGAAINASTNQYVMYGWANSYFDESNKLIGNYELVPYQGTSVAGNKIKTKGKPAWVMIKRTDVSGNWTVVDNQRGNFDYTLQPNASTTEYTASDVANIVSDGFVLQFIGGEVNVAGGQYIALVAYDTNSNGGGSYYPLASDTANVQINNALIPLAQGIDGNGAKNTILSKNETITGLTYTQGKNYVYCDKNGSCGVTPYKPRYLESELVRTFASEAPEYYDVESNKWFNCDAGAELVTNGTFSSGVTTGWTAINSTLSAVNNTLRVTVTNASGYGGCYQTLTNLVVGKKYRYILSGSLVTATQFLIRVGVPPFASYDYASSWSTISNTMYIDFVALYTTMAVECTFGTTNGATGSIDNVSVFPIDIVPTTEITNSRNYLNHIVYADNDGGVLYVEELPKVEYKDVVKANEFKGKNACTAWVNFDGTTTPPTIRDSYNVSAVIRTATGYFDCYFKEPMDTTTYTGFVSYTWQGNVASSGSFDGGSIYKFQVRHSENGAFANSSINTVLIFGGRN